MAKTRLFNVFLRVAWFVSVAYLQLQEETIKPSVSETTKTFPSSIDTPGSKFQMLVVAEDNGGNVERVDDNIDNICNTTAGMPNTTLNRTFVTECLSSPDILQKTGTPTNLKNYTWDQLKNKIISHLDILCPYGRVCREEAKQEVPKFFTSCCKECSCEPDCGSYGNCCFGSDDRPADKSLESCLHPTTAEILFQRRYFYRAYTMVTKCPPEYQRKLDGQIRTISDCGDISVAPWGNLYPVYSGSNRKIYKNSACAACHDVNDGRVWNAFMTCNMNDNELNRIRDLEDFDTFISGEYTNDLCQVNFMPPDDIAPDPTSYLQRYECVHNTTDTCFDQFTTPDEMRDLFSDEEIVDACYSDFRVPTLARGPFYNIFCSVCAQKVNNIIHICVPQEAFPREFGHGFSALIFPSTVRSMMEKNRQLSVRTACFGEDSVPQECRIVHCPTGKMRSQVGKCLFQSNWYITAVELNLKLKPVQGEIQTEHLTFSEGSKTILNKFLSPWPKTWKIKMVGYFKDGGTSKVEYFFVVITLQAAINQSKLLETIRRFTSQAWEFDLDGNKTKLESDFSEFKTYYYNSFLTPYKGLAYPLGPELPEDKTNFTNIEWPVIYYDGTLRPKPSLLVISRMFFCEQVQLAQNEFELRYGNYCLYYNRTGRLFFDGEFALVSTAYRSYQARVCLEDSGFHVISNAWTLMFKTQLGFVVFLIYVFMCHG